MRKNPTKAIEEFRVVEGTYASTASMGANGAFVIPGPGGVLLRVMCSDGSCWQEAFGDGKPWEHVSVSLPARCPTWDEMDFVKRIFWRDDECVMQLHVPRSDHRNYHPHCLHLWRPTNQEIPRPPAETVAPASAR